MLWSAPVLADARMLGSEGFRRIRSGWWWSRCSDPRAARRGERAALAADPCRAAWSVLACLDAARTGARCRSATLVYQTGHRRFQPWTRSGKRAEALPSLAMHRQERGCFQPGCSVCGCCLREREKGGGLRSVGRAGAKAARSSLSPRLTVSFAPYLLPALVRRSAAWSKQSPAAVSSTNFRPGSSGTRLTTRTHSPIHA